MEEGGGAESVLPTIGHKVKEGSPGKRSSTKVSGGNQYKEHRG